MIGAAAKRPKRLWVVAIMNIAVALMGIGTLAFMLTSSTFPPELVPSKWSAAFSVFIATAVIVSSLLALLKFRRARWVALTAALVFFGVLLVQSLILAIDPQALLGEIPSKIQSRKLWAGVTRNSIEIGLNLWAFLSAKTAAFFRG
jgi:hypothetical protein